VIGFLRPLSALRATPPTPEPQDLLISGQKVSLHFKRNARARRMVLRFDGKTGGLVMTLPRRTGLAEALRFVDKSAAWILRHMGKQVPRKAIADGATLLFRGEMHILKLTGDKRGLVEVSEGVIIVPGDAAHTERRLKDFIKKRALGDLTEASQRYALAMNARYRNITLRDQKSRWGSCSASGGLSYSWRLMLAPAFVLDYVAAHEVAHLREMNHGPRFWRLVLTHCPHAKQAKAWMKQQARELHSYF
jgi:predicted metal-dependent hydrolase